MPARTATPFPSQFVYQDVEPEVLEQEDAAMTGIASAYSDDAWRDFLRKMLPAHREVRGLPAG
jgi:hypothetical protein